jgi:ElaB/YqjD/DUF883 family membrane-anchored ribosome-binding protein
MAKNRREEDFLAITDEIAAMRDEIAQLAASVKKHAEDSSLKTNDAGGQDPGEGEHIGWTELQQTLEEVRARSELALKDLTKEIERHPLRSIAVAIGIGYIVARLFGRGRNR